MVDLFEVGLAHVDADGRVLHSNRSFARLLGYPAGIAPATSLVEAGWPTVDPKADPRSLLSAVLEGDAVDGIFSMHGPGELARELRVRGVPTREGDVVVGGIFSVAEVPVHLARQHSVGKLADAYQVMADNLVDVVLVTGPQGITWASPSAQHALGYSPEELLGRTLRTLTHPDDRRALDATVTAPVTTVRHRLCSAEGVHRWFETNQTTRFDGEQVVAVYSSSRDIQDRVALEEQLKATEQRKHDALDASPDGFAIYRADRDASGIVTALRLHFINAVGAAGFAGDAATLLGQDLLDFYPEGIENGVWSDLVTALHTGRPQHSHVEGPGPSWAGSIHAIQARLDADTVLSTWRDVSDQVRHEHRLAATRDEAAASRATLQAALDATSDGFIVLDIVRDERGTACRLSVVTSNAAATAPRGLSPEDVRGLDPRDFSDTWETTGLRDQILAAVADGQIRTTRVHVDDPTGKWLVSQDHTIAPVGLDRVVLTFRDVTADERARRDLERSRREAEHSATHDPLTDLANRALLLKHLEEALTGCDPGQRVGVIFCDLNDFKAVNDTYGHAAGDIILKATADRLRAMIRPQDTAARLAGDEFVVILRHLPAGWDTIHFVQRLTDRLSQPVSVDATLLAPSASLGIYLADPRARPDLDTDPDVVLAQADRAMYLTKHAQRADSEPQSQRPKR